MLYLILLVLATVAVTLLMRRAAAPAGECTAEPSGEWTPVQRRIAAAVAVVGVALRLVGFSDSLDLDEFGTLWAIEGGFSTAVDRSINFHGQSPFYYLIVWAFVNVLGESEVVLRLPSLLLTAAAAIVVYRTGQLLHGHRAGLFAASVFWLTPTVIQFSAGARPYSLAILFAAIALYGFIRAALDGGIAGRMWFIAGGVGVIAAHYLWGLELLGIGVAYLVTPALRRRYPLKSFFVDVAAMALFAAPLFPQVLALWSRRSELLWIPQINYNGMFLPFVPAAALIGSGLAAGAFLVRRPRLEGSLTLLFSAAAAPPLTLLAMAHLGTNLLVARYMAGGLVAACVLAGVAMALLPTRRTYLGWTGWAIITALILSIGFGYTGVFSRPGISNWRAAAVEMDRRLRDDPSAPILFRSGFIEDDQWAYGREASPALTSPLRSPGQRAPTWNLVPLTYNWDLEAREEYFERTIPLAIEGHAVFYYFSCRCAAGPPSANYEQRLTDWVAKRFGNRYQAEPIDVGRGMIAIRFEAVASDGDLGASPTPLKGSTP